MTKGKRTLRPGEVVVTDGPPSNVVAMAVAQAPPYFVVEADTVRELVEAVNDNIDRHTAPVGGPFKFFNDSFDKPRWGQAMFRKLSIN